MKGLNLASRHFYVPWCKVNMWIFPFLFIGMLATVMQCEVSLNYSEVQKLGNSCPQLDSCAHYRASGSRELFTSKERNCACDYLCSDYGDCCIDAPGIKITNKLSEYSCYELKQFGGVYMIDTCSSSYDGPNEVRYLCEATKLGDLADPLGAMPVTDSVTGVTYKNYYCNICNNKTQNAVLWTPRLECPTVTLFHSSENITNDYVLQNLASVGNNWGLYLANDNGSLFFHDCDVDPVMPVHLVNKIRFCKPDLISDCSPEWQQEDVKTMCRSYMGARYIHGGDKFRNAHCALCNYMNTTHLSCQSAELRGMVFFRQFESHAFSLLLDINEAKGQEVGLVQVCENGEVFDPFFKKCRSLLCLPGYVKLGDRCVLKDVTYDSTLSPNSGDGPIISVGPEVIEIDSEENMFNSFLQYRPGPDKSGKIELGNISGVSYNVSDIVSDDALQNELNKLQNCLLISLSNEDYVMLPNKSIYVPKYSKFYEPTSYHAADGSILVCSHLNSESDVKFMPLMGYVTISCLVISMVCLLLHFIAFCIVPDLRNLSGKNLVSQCVALFCAYLSFIIGLSDSLTFTCCSVMAFLTYYFFQVSFFWMAIMAYDVFRTLRMATTELRVSSGRQIKRFLSYSFFTWITPIFLVLIIAFAEYTDIFPSEYRPGFASPQCWFKRRRALLVFFAVPLVTIMVANLLLFLMSARMILSTTQTAAKQQNQSQKRNFKLYLRLALLMGLTWIIGLVAAYADIEILWYVFVVLNTLQGLFIFVAFSCSTKVINYMKIKCRFSNATPDTSQSASAFNTSSTHLHTNLAKKLSTKFLLRQKDSTSTNSSNSVHLAHQMHSPI